MSEGSQLKGHTHVSSTGRARSEPLMPLLIVALIHGVTPQ